jgi:hypothetical protein
MKQILNLLFFSEARWSLKESRRRASDQPHQGVARPLGRARGWCRAPSRPLTPSLRLYKVFWSQNPKSIGVSPSKVLQRCHHRRPILGDKSLHFGTLSGQGSAPGAISIASTTVSIDFTAISMNVAVSHDEEGAVLPQGWGLYR